MISNVLIIEDDPMVAMLNKEFLLKILPEINLFAAKTMAEALQIVGNEKIDLMLVDVYLPDGTGLEFLATISETKRIPSILITAANDDQSVKQALELGVIDYLIKPFKFDRFKQGIQKGIEHIKLKESSQAVDQELLDSYFASQIDDSSIEKQGSKEELPKGLTHFTLVRIIEVLLAANGYVSLKELTNQTDISRITIKKYLDYLEEMDYLDEEMSYLEQGRPVTKYKVTASAVAELKKVK